MPLENQSLSRQVYFITTERRNLTVQYHWRPNFTPKQFDFEETMRVQGLDPDYAKRQLFETMKKGETIGWTMMVQVMTPEEATKTAFDPFDVTKIWPRCMSSSGYVPREIADNQPSSRCRKSEC
jgi:catalase